MSIKNKVGIGVLAACGIANVVAIALDLKFGFGMLLSEVLLVTGYFLLKDYKKK